MAQLGNTNIYGNLTVTGTTTSSGNFIGNLTGNASSATNDSADQPIASTYIKGLKVDGQTITYTRGNDTKGTITTQDTTYLDMKGATASADGAGGLVPAPTKGKHYSFLRGDGNWIVPTNTIPQGYCPTGGSTAAKTASCSDYILAAKSYLMVIMVSENTVKSALTLNVNGKGAKPIYINGKVSSNSNYILPAGSYLTYYDGTNYYFRTDGLITGNITGSSESCTGNATTATKLETARSLNIANSDGTNASTGVNFNGSANVTLKLPTTIKASFSGSLTGNADTATTATNSTKLHTITSSTNADHFLTFVDSNNSSATSETVYTNGNLKYNPSTNTLTATTFSGNATSATSATNDSDGNKISSTYLSLSGGTITGDLIVKSSSLQYGKIKMGVDGESGYIELYNQNLGKANNSAHLDMYNNVFRVVKNNADGKTYVPLQVENERVLGSNIEGAVWNDLSDSIPVDDDCELEHGYCYCFNGEKYIKSSKYLDEGIIGIHSDTYGFRMGAEEGKKKMDVAVAGFVLAYVDKEYKPGTPLTCTENGYLTEIKKEDKIEYPERIVATYWKREPADEWGSDSRKVKVNGRKWVKVV